MASEKILQQKIAIVEELADKMKNAKCGVLFDYKTITVEEDTKLRREMRDAGIEYSVVKNTLTSKACDIIGFEDLKGVLEGMTSMAISNDDPIAPAKILNEYAKKNDNFVLKAGFMDGTVLDHDGITALAAIPSKEVLIGRMMGSLQSSLYGFAFGLQAIIDKKTEEESATA